MPIDLIEALSFGDGRFTRAFTASLDAPFVAFRSIRHGIDLARERAGSAHDSVATRAAPIR
jgi:hypothetical protein